MTPALEMICELCKKEMRPYEHKHKEDGRAVSHLDCYEEGKRVESDHLDMLIDDSKMDRSY